MWWRWRWRCYYICACVVRVLSLCFAWQRLGLFVCRAWVCACLCHARCSGVPMCCAGSQCKGRSKIKSQKQKQNTKAKCKSLPSLPLPWPLPLPLSLPLSSPAASVVAATMPTTSPIVVVVGRGAVHCSCLLQEQCPTRRRGGGRRGWGWHQGRRWQLGHRPRLVAYNHAW